MHEPPFANSSRCQPRPIRLGQHLIIRVFRCEKVNKPSAKESPQPDPQAQIVRARTAGKSTDGPVSRQTQLSGRHRLRLGYSDSPRSHKPVLPPSFLRRRISEISIPRSTALHMSYTVRHATLAAVRASISMPVLPVTPVVVVT